MSTPNNHLMYILYIKAHKERKNTNAAGNKYHRGLVYITLVKLFIVSIMFKCVHNVFYI